MSKTEHVFVFSRNCLVIESCYCESSIENGIINRSDSTTRIVNTFLQHHSYQSQNLFRSYQDTAYELFYTKYWIQILKTYDYPSFIQNIDVENNCLILIVSQSIYSTITIQNSIYLHCNLEINFKIFFYFSVKTTWPQTYT